jgi:predicted RNA binding protein YcfA (HicA-like mRNA interferase family)
VSQWPSSKASKVFRALLRIGFKIKAQKGSHTVLTHAERGDYVWAFHDGVEIGPKMLARIAKHTGLRPEDL